MRIEVFEPGKRQLIISPACRADLDNLVALEIFSELG
jgi:hypothetical protein